MNATKDVEKGPSAGSGRRRGRTMMRKMSLGAIAVIVLACYGVPYGLLSDVHSWTGAFAFWSLAGVLVIIFNVLATAGFGRGGR